MHELSVLYQLCFPSNYNSANPEHFDDFVKGPRNIQIQRNLDKYAIPVENVPDGDLLVTVT